jgi:hypothetical protein
MVPARIRIILSLEGSANVIAEWSAYAHSTTDAIKLTEGLDWPDGAVRMRVLDSDGASGDSALNPPAILPSGHQPASVRA